MVFERGFMTQIPKVKPLRSKGFTFGILKFASLTRTDVILSAYSAFQASEVQDYFPASGKQFCTSLGHILDYKG